MKKRIIIDTDMGADDYIAIQLAILSKKFKIEGITLTHGNTSMENIRKNIFKTFDMINYNDKIKVYEGSNGPIKDYNVNTKDNAHGDNGFSGIAYKPVNGKIEEKSAIDWLIDSVNNNPKKITIVAMGPLTNIAKAIQKNKDFAKNVKEIIIMGGAENFGNITPYAEFNFYNDPVAADIVFNAGIKKLIMIGFNITKYVTINPKLESLLKNSKDKKARFLYEITRTSANLDKTKNKTDGAIINEALNICYLINEKCIKLKKARVTIETNNIKHLAESKVSYEKVFNCKIAINVNKRKCLKIILFTILPNIKKELKKVL